VRTDGRAKAAGRVAWLAGGCVVEVWRGKKNTSDERIFGEEGGRREEEGGRKEKMAAREERGRREGERFVAENCFTCCFTI